MPIAVSETHRDFCLSTVSRDTNNTHLDMDNVALVAHGLKNPRHWFAHKIPKFFETPIFNLLRGHPSDA